ncbi:hypothetical protein L6R52_20910 [Myxococcota bacterium]|nr:hypothetical protein [Myxococcota bacterium]
MASGQGRRDKTAAASEAARAEGDVRVGGGHLARRHRRVGFTALALALAAGAALEVLLGYKVSSYLLDPLRRELWSLAHFHGALFGILNLVLVPWVERAELSPALQRAASRGLVLGTVLLPLGFFGGGIAHPEGDPSVAILLVPVGALAALFAITTHAWAAWRAA